MRFMNPAGLWLLLGVPVLIVIYLIKAQHEDRPVSSTYIWKLSDQFMKKRLPVQKIRKLLAFLLQLAVILGIALAVARPAFVNGKSCDYIAILDGSASMQTQDDTGKSRFDYALEQVEVLAEEVERGHTVSVILAEQNAAWLTQRSTSKNEIKMALSNARCTYNTCNITAALELTQQFSLSSKNPQILFFTDQSYDKTYNVQAVDLNKGEWNVSVEAVTAKSAQEGTAFSATLTSHNRDAELTVGLQINGQLADAQIVQLAQDTPVSVTFTEAGVASFDTAEIFVETSDGLQADNSYALCRKAERTSRIMLVSESPLYLESAFNALGNCKVTVAASAQEAELTGYDLYVFDCVAPESYPQDGSVLVFGTQLLPEGLTAAAPANTEAGLTMDANTESQLYTQLSLVDTVVTNYSGLKGSLAWENVFYCGDDAVIATRDMGNNLQFTLVSFDLRDSNLPMQTDFLLLMENLVEYSVPAFLKDTDHTIGSNVVFTVMPNAREIYVELPNDSVWELSTAAPTASMHVDRVGVYTAVMTTQDSGEYVDFFVHIPQEEMISEALSELAVELPAAQEEQTEDALSELWFWILLTMLLVVLVEWGWYYREQY